MTQKGTLRPESGKVSVAAARIVSGDIYSRYGHDNTKGTFDQQ